MNKKLVTLSNSKVFLLTDYYNEKCTSYGVGDEKVAVSGGDLYNCVVYIDTYNITKESNCRLKCVK